MERFCQEVGIFLTEILGSERLLSNMSITGRDLSFSVELNRPGEFST